MIRVNNEPISIRLRGQNHCARLAPSANHHWQPICSRELSSTWSCLWWQCRQEVRSNMPSAPTKWLGIVQVQSIPVEAATLEHYRVSAGKRDTRQEPRRYRAMLGPWSPHLADALSEDHRLRPCCRRRQKSAIALIELDLRWISGMPKLSRFPVFA